MQAVLSRLLQRERCRQLRTILHATHYQSQAYSMLAQYWEEFVLEMLAPHTLGLHLCFSNRSNRLFATRSKGCHPSPLSKDLPAVWMWVSSEVVANHLEWLISLPGCPKLFVVLTQGDQLCDSGRRVTSHLLPLPLGSEAPSASSNSP